MTNTLNDALTAAQYTANTIQEPIHILHLNDGRYSLAFYNTVIVVKNGQSFMSGNPVTVIKTIQPQTNSVLKNHTSKIPTAHLRVN